MNTFIKLYEFLQSYEDENIIEWLENPWEGKDKQESLLRLFAGLGLIEKLNSYTICKGNFNLKTITKHTSLKDIFYDESTVNNLKDKGDASDLTGISKENDNHLLLTTSKNLNKTQVGKLDIDKILTNFKQYDGYTMSLCICIRNYDYFKVMKKGIEKSNKILLSFLEKKDTIIIDWNDLNQGYHQFKLSYGDKPIDDIIKLNRYTLIPKMHQELGVNKTIYLKKRGMKQALWGHIQRSGKSFINALTIIEDSKHQEECNYLIITTKPNETIEQQHKVLECNQLNDFNIIKLDGSNKNPKLTKKNIIICSKQFLQHKINNKNKKNNEEKPLSIPWLKELKISMRFIDESHNGGTTLLAKKTLDFYGKDAFTIYITATYSKPVNNYNIPRECWVLWDIEDIKLCKNIKNQDSIDRLVEKHGDDIKKLLNNYSSENIISEYSKYPDINILTRKIDKKFVPEIIRETKDNDYGWSTEACFLLKYVEDNTIENSSLQIKPEFQNEKEALKVWYTIFGKKNNFGIPDSQYPDNIVFMKRYQNMCKTFDSRCIGQGEFINNPMVIMTFLPVYTDRGEGYLSKLSEATIKLLEKHNVCENYHIITINDEGKNKKDIEDARKTAKIQGKQGVLVLTATKCGCGYTPPDCDIVLLLNNNKCSDSILQMMFRSMTEGKNKKVGFVFDLNIHRAINTSFNYASMIKPKNHPRDGLKYILQEKLINLNADHWMPSFGNNISEISSLSESAYEIYTSNVENVMENLLNRFCLKEINLTEEEIEFMYIFNTTSIKYKQNKDHKDTRNDDDNEDNIKKGIEKNTIEQKDTDTLSETNDIDDNEHEERINYIDIIKHIIPLMCILTVHCKETTFVEMYHYIIHNTYIYDILIEQTKSWWGKSLDSNVFRKFFNIYIKYMQDDSETNQIIRNMKELIMKNIYNKKEMSKLIDKFLIPQELEKKNNAEVSTRYELRQEMLNTLPLTFWTSPKKVIEPCAGKGGFIIDIIDKFMIGLEQTIPDENERYKTIVEECLYFCDINPTNIFICKLLVDPDNRYKLNYNLGNTLNLDNSETTEHWKGCSNFDLHVCNPPYEDNVDDNNNESVGRKALNHNLYSEFINWSYGRLNSDGFLLYITPTSWMSPTSKLKHIFYQNHILYLNINECKRHFKVGSTFSYYLIKKTNNIGTTLVLCEYNKTKHTSICNLNNMEYLPNITTTESINIIKKFKQNDLQKVSFRTSCELHNTTHKNKLNDTKTDKYIYPVRHTKKRNIRYSCVQHSLHKDKKLLLNLSGNLNPLYDEGTMGFTQAQMYLLTDKKDYLNIINSKLYSFIFSICKWSGFNIEKMYHDIPFIPDNKTDLELYKLFNLTDEEIKIIESSTK